MRLNFGPATQAFFKSEFGSFGLFVWQVPEECRA